VKSVNGGVLGFWIALLVADAVPLPDEELQVCVDILLKLAN
jgi:hypothetical protein